MNTNSGEMDPDQLMGEGPESEKEDNEAELLAMGQ